MALLADCGHSIIKEDVRRANEYIDDHGLMPELPAEQAAGDLRKTETTQIESASAGHERGQNEASQPASPTSPQPAQTPQPAPQSAPQVAPQSAGVTDQGFASLISERVRRKTEILRKRFRM